MVTYPYFYLYVYNTWFCKKPGLSSKKEDYTFLNFVKTHGDFHNIRDTDVAGYLFNLESPENVNAKRDGLYKEGIDRYTVCRSQLNTKTFLL